MKGSLNLMTEIEQKKEGFGFIWLPIIGLALSCLFALANIFFYARLSEEDYSYIFMAIIEGLFFLYSATTFVLLLRRKKIAKTLYTIWLILFLIESFFNCGVVMQESGNSAIATQGFARSLITVTLWLPVFLISKKVKRVFIN